jgi:hypothetical protein
MAVNLFDSRFSDRITIFRMLLSIFGYPKSTEHPHKLPDRIVKELPDIFVRERPPILRCRPLVSRTFLTFFKLAVDGRPVRERVFYCPINRCQQLFFRLSVPSKSFPVYRKSLRGRAAHYTAITSDVNSLCESFFTSKSYTS